MSSRGQLRMHRLSLDEQIASVKVMKEYRTTKEYLIGGTACAEKKIRWKNGMLALHLKSVNSIVIEACSHRCRQNFVSGLGAVIGHAKSRGPTVYAQPIPIMLLEVHCQTNAP